MKKTTILGLSLALTVSSLAACGDQGAIDDQRLRGAGEYQPRTYISDNRDLTGNNVRNQNLGTDRMNRFGNGTTDNIGRRTPGGGYLFGGPGPRMHGGTNDALDRGNMGNGRGGNMATDGFDQNQARRLEQKILAIPGVEDARVVVYRDDIIVGLDTNGGNNALNGNTTMNGKNNRNGNSVTSQVRREVQEDARGKNVHITNDEDLFNRLGNMGNRMGNGNGPFEEMGRDIREMIDDIGDTMTNNR